MKSTIASALHVLGLDRMGFMIQRAFLQPFVRAVNYHDVPPNFADAFENQLLFYKRHFEIIGPAGLERLVSGQWASKKPGLILSFDDGLRSHAQVVAPMLEKHGLTGWFMVPVGFVDERANRQKEYAEAHQIEHAHFPYGDSRVAMTWDDVRRMGRIHEIGCHTWSHRRLSKDLSAKELLHEIPEAKNRLSAKLGIEVKTFAWVGGEEASYSENAARVIAEAGFSYSFMTNNLVIRRNADLLQLQRTNIEAHNDRRIVGFQLSGALDMIYWPKRRRVNRMTRTISGREG